MYESSPLHGHSYDYSGNIGKARDLAGSGVLGAFRKEAARSLFAVIVAALVIGMAIAAHLAHPLLAILATFTLVAVLANWMPATAIVVMLFAMIFQNLFVSIASPLIDSGTSFNIIRGYNFVILSAVWGIAFLSYVLRFRGRNEGLDHVMKVTLGLLAVIAVYFCIGFLGNPLGAVIYLRSIASAIMMFQVCLIFFSSFPIKITPALMIMGCLLIFFGYIELFFRDNWNVWVNGLDFWSISSADERNSLGWDKDAAERGVVVKSVFDTFTVDLFNTPLLDGFKVRVVRLLGPNMHPISYAYAVSFFILFSAYRGRFLYAALLVPLVIFANAKGAIILLLLVGMAWIAARLFGVKFAFAALAAVLLAYIGLGVVIGLNIGDFHVLGFMGGLYNFMDNPFGHGIGAGGNLGTDFTELDWPAYQAAGRTPIAIESAVGVMMYQMGVGAFIYLGVCVWLAWRVALFGGKTGQSLHIAAAFALLTVLVNGIFQEEALFSPLGLGFILALNGMILGISFKTNEFR